MGHFSPAFIFKGFAEKSAIAQPSQQPESLHSLSSAESEILFIPLNVLEKKSMFLFLKFLRFWKSQEHEIQSYAQK